MEPAFHVRLIVQLALGLEFVVDALWDAGNVRPLALPVCALIYLIEIRFVCFNNCCDILLSLNCCLAGFIIEMPKAGDTRIFVFIKYLFIHALKKGPGYPDPFHLITT